jgi:hypothetical protein
MRKIFLANDEFATTHPENIRSKYRCADKSLARPTSRWIMFDDENISFGASLVIYISIYIVLIFFQL